jgi:hypothetical protein
LIHAHQTQENAVDFLNALREACPTRIETILTDNGTQFTDRFLRADKKASGGHPFDQACTQNKIGHRLIPPRHPQTNGRVERMNGRIQDILQQTRFASAKELEVTLMRYLAAYNHHIPQRALAHRTPVQAIEEWMLKKPDSIRFVPVYDQAGLDTLPGPHNHHIPQRALDYQTPVQALETWKTKNPMPSDLFRNMIWRVLTADGKRVFAIRCARGWGLPGRVPRWRGQGRSGRWPVPLFGRGGTNRIGRRRGGRWDGCLAIPDASRRWPSRRDCAGRLVSAARNRTRPARFSAPGRGCP